MIIGERQFQEKGHTYVMGILNITPDSFSDGGKYNQSDKALKHVEQMITDGADIIDIGGESTRPGYEKISVEEEVERVCGMIGKIKSRFSVPVSIDTYKSEVAKEAIMAGADMVNDIWGLRFDAFSTPEEAEKIYSAGSMAQVVADFDVPVCIMHNRREAVYDYFPSEVLSDLQESLNVARDAGIARSKIILDPGIGFGKTYEMNLCMMKNLGLMSTFGLPVLLGTSRKSMIGLTLDLPVEEREEGTLVTTVMAVQAGCMFVRVHDVKKNVRAIKMTETILETEKNI